MIFSKIQTQNRLYFQLAGALYMAIAVIGGFSIGYMPTTIVVDGDAALTFENLSNNQSIFKWGIAGDIFVLMAEVVLSVMLFQLFKSFSKTSLRIATYSRLAMAIIMGINLINYAVPEILVSDTDALGSLGKGEMEALTLLFFKMHKAGEMVWQVFFSIHLFALGYALIESKITPKWLGPIMMVGSFGYGGDCMTQLLFIESKGLSMVFSALLVLAVVSELWLIFWLLIKGGVKRA